MTLLKGKINFELLLVYRAVGCLSAVDPQWNLFCPRSQKNRPQITYGQLCQVVGLFLCLTPPHHPVLSYLSTCQNQHSALTLSTWLRTVESWSMCFCQRLHSSRGERETGGQKKTTLLWYFSLFFLIRMGLRVLRGSAPPE